MVIATGTVYTCRWNKLNKKQTYVIAIVKQLVNNKCSVEQENAQSWFFGALLFLQYNFAKKCTHLNILGCSGCEKHKRLPTKLRKFFQTLPYTGLSCLTPDMHPLAQPLIFLQWSMVEELEAPSRQGCGESRCFPVARKYFVEYYVLANWFTTSCFFLLTGTKKTMLWWSGRLASCVW